MTSNPERERLAKGIENIAWYLRTGGEFKSFDGKVDADALDAAAALLRGPSEQEAQSREAPEAGLVSIVIQEAREEAALLRESVARRGGGANVRRNRDGYSSSVRRDCRLGRIPARRVCVRWEDPAGGCSFKPAPTHWQPLPPPPSEDPKP